MMTGLEGLFARIPLKGRPGGLKDVKEKRITFEKSQDNFSLPPPLQNSTRYFSTRVEENWLNAACIETKNPAPWPGPLAPLTGWRGPRDCLGPCWSIGHSTEKEVDSRKPPKKPALARPPILS